MSPTRVVKKSVPSGGHAFLMGLFCGAAAGAAIGLVFAPKPGIELREEIAESTERLRERASETFDEAVEALGALVDKGKEAFQDNGAVKHAVHATTRAAKAHAHQSA